MTSSKPMGILEIFGKNRKKEAEFPSQRKQEKEEREREKNFRIAVLRDELTTRRFWLERAKEQGNQEEIRLQEEEIKNIIEELRELGVEVEEEEKIAA
jgi:hypothetical protein